MEGCFSKKTQQELLAMRQPALDRVLGVLQANETARRESKQIRTKGGLMEFGRVDRVSGRKDGRWRVRDVLQSLRGVQLNRTPDSDGKLPRRGQDMQ